jgi:hypothetical protein
MGSTVACFDDMVAAVIAPSLGTSPDLGGEKIIISEIVASLHDCLSAGLVLVGLLPALEKQAPSDSEKENASPSLTSPTLEFFLNGGMALLQEPLPPMVSSKTLTRQDRKTDSESVECQEIAEELMVELEPDRYNKTFLTHQWQSTSCLLTNNRRLPRQCRNSSILLPQSACLGHG